MSELKPGERGDGDLEIAVFPLAKDTIRVLSRHIEKDGKFWVVGSLGVRGFPASGLLSLVRPHDFDNF